MAQNTRGQSSPPSYIDGISVKISEKYKPPKRITSALSYSQRLTLNKLIQDPFLSYDFALEESIKNRVHEWRKVRTSIAEERKQRLLNVTSDKPEVLNTINTNSDSDTTSSDVSNKDSIPENSHTYYSTESGVLIPMTVQQSVSRPITVKGFNFSEFESDTSSPFDNMELKTLNDLEELAEVLKRDNSTVNTYVPQVKKENHINGFYYHSPFSKLYPGSQTTSTQIRSVTEIMKSLEKEIASNHITEEKKIIAKKQTEDTLDNPFNSLSSELQDMAKTISSMGFPLARVARACQALEGNQKKIVEHLLAMSDLLDLGFSEQKVVNALLKCNNDRDKALDLLIT